MTLENIEDRGNDERDQAVRGDLRDPLPGHRMVGIGCPHPRSVPSDSVTTNPARRTCVRQEESSMRRTRCILNRIDLHYVLNWKVLLH